MTEILRGDHNSALKVGDIIVVSSDPRDGCGLLVTIQLERERLPVSEWQANHQCGYNIDDGWLSIIALAAGVELILQERRTNQDTGVTTRRFLVQKAVSMQVVADGYECE